MNTEIQPSVRKCLRACNSYALSPKKGAPVCSSQFKIFSPQIVNGERETRWKAGGLCLQSSTLGTVLRTSSATK